MRISHASPATPIPIRWPGARQSLAIDGRPERRRMEWPASIAFASMNLGTRKLAGPKATSCCCSRASSRSFHPEIALSGLETSSYSTQLMELATTKRPPESKRQGDEEGEGQSPWNKKANRRGENPLSSRSLNFTSISSPIWVAILVRIATKIQRNSRGKRLVWSCEFVFVQHTLSLSLSLSYSNTIAIQRHRQTHCNGAGYPLAVYINVFVSRSSCLYYFRRPQRAATSVERPLGAQHPARTSRL